MPFITFKEKLAHYTSVAAGTKPVKAGSKYSASEQQAYARGQRDAFNEQRRAYAYKNATPEQRDAYKAQRKARNAAYYASKKK